MADGVISPLFPPAQLTRFVQRIVEDLPINEHLGEQFFPTEFTPNDNWTTGLQSNRDYTEEAEYRAWNTESTIGSRPGLFRITGNLVPISRKIPLHEDYIRLLKNASANQVPDIVRTQVFNDAERLARMVRNRIERARWEVIDNATFTIGNPGGATYPATENGLQMRVDFTRNAGNRYSVGTFWDAGSPTPLQDELTLIRNAADAGVDLAGGVMVASQAIINALALSSDYRNAYPSFRAAAMLPLSQINEVRNLWGLPQIVRLDAKVKRRTAAGTDSVVSVADSKRAYFLPSTQVGQTLWAPSAYSGEPEVQAGGNGGPVVFVMKTLDPLTYWTCIDAPVIPILFQPNDTYSVKVLT